MRKPPSATPDGWLAMTREALGGALPEATRLNGALVEALYARDPVTEERLAELRRALKGFRRVKS
jgi:hypothetical protein